MGKTPVIVPPTNSLISGSSSAPVIGGNTFLYNTISDRYFVPYQISSDGNVIAARNALIELDNLKERLDNYATTIKKIIANGSFESSTAIYGKPFVDLHKSANSAIGTASSNLDSERDEASASLDEPISTANQNFINAKTKAMKAYNEKQAEEAKKGGSK